MGIRILVFFLNLLIRLTQYTLSSCNTFCLSSERQQKNGLDLFKTDNLDYFKSVSA